MAMMMTRPSILVVAAALVAGLYQPTAAQASRPTAPPRASLAQPGIAPDGEEIAFSRPVTFGSFPPVAGDARLLIAHAASDERPLYSPDGPASPSSPIAAAAGTFGSSRSPAARSPGSLETMPMSTWTRGHPTARGSTSLATMMCIVSARREARRCPSRRTGI